MSSTAFVRLLPLLLLASGPTLAQEAEDKPWSVNLSFASDYRFRGVSQNQDDPVLQLGFDFAFPTGFYVGTWASNVDFVDGDGANFELDLYAGYAHSFAEDWTLDGQIIRYFYPSSEADYDYTEVIGALSWKDMLSFSIGYSSDVFASGETGIYYALSGSYPIYEEYSLAATIGVYDLDDIAGGSYSHYELGVSRSFGPLDVSVTYHNGNRKLTEFFGGADASRFVFAISTQF